MWVQNWNSNDFNIQLVLLQFILFYLYWYVNHHIFIIYKYIKCVRLRAVFQSRVHFNSALNVQYTFFCLKSLLLLWSSGNSSSSARYLIASVSFILIITVNVWVSLPFFIFYHDPIIYGHMFYIVYKISIFSFVTISLKKMEVERV